MHPSAMLRTARIRGTTEQDGDDASVHRPLTDLRVPGQQAEHPVIFGQDLSVKRGEPSLLAGAHDLGLEHCPQSHALPGVLHDEADVRSSIITAQAISGDSDQLARLSDVTRGDDRQAVMTVDGGKRHRVLGAEPANAEETLVDRPRAQSAAEREQTGRVIRPDRAEANTRSIVERGEPPGGEPASDLHGEVHGPGPRARAQARAFRTSCRTALGTAPTIRSPTSPAATNRIVGIDRMSYLTASPGFSSTLTLASVTRPSEASASSSRTGAIARHGPHHSAQKSTIIRPGLAIRASSKVCSVRWTVSDAP